jgi:dihydrolipoamide dehydrogenase
LRCVGHGAALHARGQGLKTAIFTGADVGGTCVNRGCVPSKALLAASGRVREMQDTEHLAGFGIEVGDVKYDREKVAEHAAQLVSNVAKNLGNSLTALGVDQIHASGVYAGPHKVKNANTGEIVTAKDIILAPGSVPFVPPGIQVAESKSVGDEKHLSLYIPPRPECCQRGSSCDEPATRACAAGCGLAHEWRERLRSLVGGSVVR